MKSHTLFPSWNTVTKDTLAGPLHPARDAFTPATFFCSIHLVHIPGNAQLLAFAEILQWELMHSKCFLYLSLDFPRMPPQSTSLPVEEVGENVTMLWIHNINWVLFLQNGNRVRTLCHIRIYSLIQHIFFCVNSVASSVLGLHQWRKN